MVLKIFLTLLILTFVFSCADRLTMLTKSYNPVLNSKLHFDGYYTRRENPIDVPITTRRWVQPITPKFFFENGSVAYLPTHENEQQLTETFTKYKRDNANWGIYQTKGDTLITEVLQPNSGTLRKEKFTNKLIIKKDTLVLFMWTDRKGKITKSIDTLYFKPFPYRPNTKNSYIK